MIDTDVKKDMRVEVVVSAIGYMDIVGSHYKTDAGTVDYAGYVVGNDEDYLTMALLKTANGYRYVVRIPVGHIMGIVILNGIVDRSHAWHHGCRKGLENA